MDEIYFSEAKTLVDLHKEDYKLTSSEIFLPSLWVGADSWDLSQYAEKEVWSLGKYEKELEKYILSREGKFSLLAFSNAGNPALEVALRHPEKIEKLIFMESILDWRYNERDLRILTNIFGRLPWMLKRSIGWCHGILIDYLLRSEMIDYKKIKETPVSIYKNILKITRDHGGENISNALFNALEYSSSSSSYCSDNLRRLNELIEKGKVDVHFIYASGSKDTRRYLGELSPKIKAYEIDSKHLVTIQNPDGFEDVLDLILRK